MNGTPSTNPNRPYERTLSLAAASGRIGPIGVAARLIIGTTLIVSRCSGAIRTGAMPPSASSPFPA